MDLEFEAQPVEMPETTSKGVLCPGIIKLIEMTSFDSQQLTLT